MPEGGYLTEQKGMDGALKYLAGQGYSPFRPLVCRSVGITQPQAPGMREMNAKEPRPLEVKGRPPAFSMATSALPAIARCL